VRAPFDGIVVLKDAEVGEVVSPNVVGGTSARGSVVTMVDFKSLEVQAEVPETSLAAVKIGSPTQVFLDAYPDKAYKGRVDRIWPTANRTKATVEVRIAFEDRDDRLRPEMGARIVFLDANAAKGPSPSDGDAAPALLIPANAVLRMDGQTGVFVLERDIVRFQRLALGEQRLGKIDVIEGLSEGDEIVLDPPATLKHGDRVRIKGASTARTQPTHRPDADRSRRAGIADHDARRASKHYIMGAKHDENDACDARGATIDALHAERDAR